MKNKYIFMILSCILMAVAGGCTAEEADRINSGVAIGHGLISMNGFVSDNELSNMEELTDAMITSMEENEKQVSYVVDEGVADNPLFVSFINNEIQAYGGINKFGGLKEYYEDSRTAYELDDKEMYFTDYYEHDKRRCEAIHFMVEDMDGDGEAELLINLCYGYHGTILVFHEQDGKLFEWEDLGYGDHSPAIYIYDDYTIEVEGVQWSRSFFSYTSTGRRPRVFDQYSLTGDLPEGGSYREYWIDEFQNGIEIKELKITEGWSDDGTYLGVFESKAEEEEFDRVYDGFIDALGERKKLNFPEGGFGDAPAVTRKKIMNGFQFITN